MRKCNKSIVECLRDYKIEPYAEANSFIEEYPPSNAINYSNSHNFHTGFPTSQVWWMVDFKTQVSIKSYQFDAGDYCDWIKYWQISVSDDNITWKVADSPSQQFAENKIFELKYPAAGRYFRVTSLNGDCGYTMVFRKIRIYGSYFVFNKRPKCTGLKRYRMNHLIIQILSLVYS